MTPYACKQYLLVLYIAWKWRYWSCVIFGHIFCSQSAGTIFYTKGEERLVFFFVLDRDVNLYNKLGSIWGHGLEWKIDFFSSHIDFPQIVLDHRVFSSYYHEFLQTPSFALLLVFVLRFLYIKSIFFICHDLSIRLNLYEVRSLKSPYHSKAKDGVRFKRSETSAFYLLLSVIPFIKIWYMYLAWN